MQEYSNVLKPKKSTYIFTRVHAWIVLSGLMLLGSISAELSGVAGTLLPVIAMIALGTGLVFYLAGVAYGKERYEFGENQVRCESGGVFSHRVIDLDVRNITHVKQHLPWFRWKFFRVGNVRIESAGSASSEIVLESIQDPDAVYAQVLNLMKSNGFNLEKNELLHEERPAPAGVFMDCIGIGLSALFVLSMFALQFLVEADPWDWGAQLTALFNVANSVIENGVESSWMILALLVEVVVVLGVFVLMVLHWMDASRRTYRVFDDCVVYEEGFLTRTNAFIPVENIADSSTNRGLVGQILGISSVSISCQGSGSEIRFRNLRRADAISDTIDQLVGRARERTERARELEEQPPTLMGEATPVGSSASRVRPEDAWTAEFQMDMKRALMPLLWMAPAVPVWIVASISVALGVLHTRFSIREHSVRSTYDFVSLRQREFNYDKVTGVVFVRNFWDFMFDTMTVSIWSIGSSAPLNIQHVLCADFDRAAFLHQAGIAPSECQREIQPSLNRQSWLLGNLPLLGGCGFLATVILLLSFWRPYLLLGLLPLAGLLVWQWVGDWFWCKYQRLRFYEHHVEAETGFVTRKHFHIAFSDIKKVVTTRYPKCGIGSLQLFAAGERIVAKKQAKEQGMMSAGGGTVMPYGFRARFIDEVQALGEDVDVWLEREAGTPRRERTLLCASRPDLANGLVVLLVGSVIVLPMVFLLPLTFPWLVFLIRAQSYRLETGRVVVRSGLWFRRTQSVLWRRIDSLEKERGCRNTMCGNGSVTLLTAGSSRPDLVLPAMADFEDFYGKIHEQYGGQ